MEYKAGTAWQWRAGWIAAGRLIEARPIGQGGQQPAVRARQRVIPGPRQHAWIPHAAGL